MTVKAPALVRGETNLDRIVTTINLLQANGADADSVASLNTSVSSIGEYLSSSVPVGSAISLTTATPASFVKLDLTEGSWDVSGNAAFAPAPATSMVVCIASFNTAASNALPTLPASGGRTQVGNAFTGGVTQVFPVGPMRVDAGSAGATVHFVVQANYTSSTVTSFGFIRATRVKAP